MQPENNNVQATAPATTPINPGGDVVFRDKPKKNTGMLIGMIILALLAAGGIGFGVWTYLSDNQKVEDLNKQVSELKQKNDELSQQVAEKDNMIEELQKTHSDDPQKDTPLKWGVDENQFFYIEDSEGNIVTKDELIKVTEIISCDSGTSEAVQQEGLIIKCNVTTTEGDGAFVYDSNAETLTYTKK